MLLPAERFFEADAQAVLIAAGDERGARRRADRGVRVALKKADAARRDAVDVRRLEIPAPVAGDVRVAEIVGHDVDDVGRSLARLTQNVARRHRQRSQGSRAQNRAAAHAFGRRCARHGEYTPGVFDSV